MAEATIPDDVVRFITARIDTVPHLEALLLLWESAPRGWTPQEIAVRVYVPVDQATVILKELVWQKLASPETQAPDRYRYDSAWDDTSRMMERVATTYRQQLVPVATLIHSKASTAVHQFARAFQFKKE